MELGMISSSHALLSLVCVAAITGTVDARGRGKFAACRRSYISANLLVLFFVPQYNHYLDTARKTHKANIAHLLIFNARRLHLQADYINDLFLLI